MTRRRIGIVVALAGAAVTAVVVLVLVGRNAPSSVPRQAVSGETRLSRSAALFADPLQAIIEVVVDRRRVDPSRVGFTPRFQPYVRIGARVSRHDVGRLTRLVYTADLVCLTDACLPPGSSARVQFPPAEIFYWPRSGARRTVELAWLPLTVAGRTSDADLANADPYEQPSWHATTEALAVSYRLSPPLLRTLLFVACGLLFVGAAAALVRFLQAGRLRVRLPLLSPLERAVMLVERTAARGDAPERRKALELLSRELARTGERELALTARELAWAEPGPVPGATHPLTLDVRQVIEQRSNGHAR